MLLVDRKSFSSASIALKNGKFPISMEERD